MAIGQLANELQMDFNLLEPDGTEIDSQLEAYNVADATNLRPNQELLKAQGVQQVI